MLASNSKLVSAIAALIVVIGSAVILNGYFNTTVGRVIFEGKFPPNSHVDVTVMNRFGSKVTERVEFNAHSSNTPIKVGTGIMNAPLGRLLLRFTPPADSASASEHVFNIYNLEITQPLARTALITQGRLKENFLSDDFVSASSNLLRANPTTGVAELYLSRPVTTINRAWLLGMSLFMGMLAWLLVRYSAWRTIPAIADMRLGREISSKNEFDTVNGIRGVAALLVLFSHSAPGFFAINMGIALLFVISGFLLSKPFVLDSARIYSWQTIEVYLAKRVKRILPMYYFFIVITYVATSQFDTALRNFLFIEASGHLWPMTQIFTFYLCLPLVLLLTSLLSRVHSLLPILLLLVCATLWELFMKEWRPFYNGRYATEFHLFAFLLGVAGSYLNYSLLAQSTAWQNLLKRAMQPLSIVLLVLAVLTIAWSAPVAPPEFILPFISQFYVKCILSVLIIILALQVSGAWLTGFMIANPLFRSVGIIGFSFYLLHGLGIELALNMQAKLFGMVDPSDRSWSLMLMAFVITYLMALFTYSFIERPFFGHKNRDVK